MLTLIVSVSAGVSVPFVLIAFNLERVKAWPRTVLYWTRAAPLASACVGVIFLVVIVGLAATLSQPLAPAVKAGVGIGLAFLATAAALTILLSRHARHWNRRYV